MRRTPFKQFLKFLPMMLLVCISALPALANGGGPGPLTGPQKGEPAALAWTYLQTHLQDLGLTRQDIQGLRPGDQIIRAGEASHLYWNQYHRGLRVHGADLAIHVAADGRILALHNRLVPGLSSREGTPVPGLPAARAIEGAGLALGLTATGPVLEQVPAAGIEAKGRFSAPGLSGDPVDTELRFAVLPKNRVALAWHMVLRTPDGQHWYELTVDAGSGEILGKADWVISEAWAPEGYRPLPVVSDGADLQAPQADTTPVPMAPDSYNVYAAPIVDPDHGSRSIISNPADATASPFGWHDTNGVAGAEYTITRGNNVHAYQDSNASNSSSGDEPDGGASLDFDFPVDLAQQPGTYVDAAVVNLFYWNNLIHDVFYHHGFTEADGNFQQNNYGNGGSGGDYVLAEAQDGSGLNNANFGTPPDGSSGRMQMFLWDPSRPTVTVLTPGSIAGDYDAGGAEFGPVLTFAGTSGTVVLADDSTATTSDACEALTNGAAVNGNIAFIDRGSCNFTVKVKNAQDAGAVAVIVANINPGEGLISMGGTDGTITIPSVFVSYEDGQTLRAEIAGGLTVNLHNPFANEPQRDGDFDNGIIVHEYGHGISTRITGGPGNSSCLQNSQSGGMGEGWGDFWALVMTTTGSDQATDARGIGTYPTWQGPNGTGIRPFPYSTDFAVNPHTYEDIDSVSIPHGVGSIWANMLWQMYWDLVDAYGFDADLIGGTGGNIMALDLVNEGISLQPCDPTIIEARDAILLADQSLNAGANQCLIWKAFARRGLGYSATDGGGGGSVVVTEAYDLPPSCALTVSTSIDLNPVEAGDTVTYTLDITNNTGEDLTGLLLTDSLPQRTTYVAGSASDGGGLSAGQLAWPAFSLLNGASTQRTFQVKVDGDFGGITTFYQQDFNSPATDWTTTIVSGSTNWSQSTTNDRSAPLSFRAPDVGSVTEFHLTLNTPQTLPPGAVLRFWQDINTEGGYDGGVVEVSTDGSTWTDAGPRFFTYGYNGALSTCCSNPLGGRAAFTGSSGGYVQSAIDLTDLAGENFQVRFIMSSDSGVAGVAWDIDDLVIQTESIFTNSVALTSDQGYNDSEDLSTSVNFGADGDGDGFADKGDCAPADDTIWTTPGPAANLTFTSAINLSWSAPADPGGDTVVYDLIRSTDPTDFSAGICVENSGSDTSGIIPQNPVAGQVYYILVAPANGCGANPGSNSDGAARSTASPCT